jgi:hypothetical protein
MTTLTRTFSSFSYGVYVKRDGEPYRRYLERDGKQMHVFLISFARMVSDAA